MKAALTSLRRTLTFRRRRAAGLALAAGMGLAGALPGTQAAEGFRPDRILIQPRAGAAAQVAAFHARQGARVHRTFPGIGGLQVLQLPPGGSPRAFVDRYLQSGLVEFAEPDYQVHPSATPNDPYYGTGALWHLHNYGQGGGTADADIDAPEAWSTLARATNIIVAIVDTGVRYTHEDLAPNMWVNPGEIPGNGLDDDGDGYVDNVHGINAAANNGNPIDLAGHGTMVAGFVGAAGNNGLGVAGVAWQVKIMACRFYDDAGNGYISDAIQAVDFARTNGAHILNTSFISTAYSSTFYSALGSCRAAGVLVVAAAGNDAVNTDVTPYYPASYNLDNIVAVAASTRNDGLAGFSNHGATSVDLAAPGETLFTTQYGSDTAYGYGSGTSFACPITAGACALLRARFPAMTYREIIQRLLGTVDPVPALAGKCVTGGRLNLARALGPSLLADFTLSPAAGPAPLTVRFTNVSYGTYTGLRWDFGDGTFSNDPNPQHTYLVPGTFTATLTLTSTVNSITSTNRPIASLGSYLMTGTDFAWLDPSNMTALAVSGDSVSPTQTLPFPFRFYGQDYTSIWVGANGLLGFSSEGLTSGANTDLPDPANPNGILCPLWDDLNPAAGSVYVGSTGTAPWRRAVVSWVGVPGAGTGPPATFSFQVLLEETSGNVLMQYLEVSPGSSSARAAGKSATIGLEHGSGLAARRFSYNGSTLLSNRQALLFAALPNSTNGPVNAPPSVSLTQPLPGSLLTAPASVTLTAQAADPDGVVARVEFFIDGAKAGEDVTSPYSLDVTGLGPGSHLLAAVATDNAGARATNQVSVLVNSLPTVQITTPAAGAILPAPATFLLAASASDADGTLAVVEFFQNTTKVGEDSTSPYSLTLSQVPAGLHRLSAVAVDNLGGRTTHSITVTVNNAPSVLISDPAPGSVWPASGSVLLAGTALDLDGNLVRVEFFADQDKLGEATSASFALPISGLPPGPHLLTVVASDELGGRGTNAVAIQINAPPVVHFTSPADGTHFLPPATVLLMAEARDADGTVVRVEFYQDDAMLEEQATSPYGTAVSGLPTGRHHFLVVATDNLGSRTTNHLTVLVDSPPIVSLLQPADGDRLGAPASVILEAAASDPDGSVVRVEFLAGTNLLGETLASPYRLAWTNVPAGLHALTARVTDDLGLRATSAVVTLTVTNLAPPLPVTLEAPAREGDSFRFSFATELGRTYVVQFTDSLPPQWQVLTNLTGDGTRRTFTNGSGGVARRFYRVESR